MPFVVQLILNIDIGMMVNCIKKYSRSKKQNYAFNSNIELSIFISEDAGIQDKKMQLLHKPEDWTVSGMI